MTTEIANDQQLGGPGKTEARLQNGGRQKHVMDALLRAHAGSAFPRLGQIMEGTVIERKGSWLYLDLDLFGTGVVYGREFFAAQDIIKGLNPGDRVSGKVVEIDNEEGYVELSLKEAGEERRWVDLKRMMEEGEVLELPVLEANRGGLILEIKNVRGFLPASHLSAPHYPRVDGGDKEKIFQELQKLVQQTLKVKILDLDPKESKLIFTERGQALEEVQSALAGYTIGDVVKGEVTTVVDFGAFMKFENADLEGLVHISEIDWTLIENPRDILKPGDKVEAKIIDIKGDKISLSLKQLKEDPWVRVEEKYHKGDVITATITKLNPFGAFAQLDKDIHGLIHISEFGTEAKMKEMLTLGAERTVKILMIDPKEHRMSLGIVREGNDHEKSDNEKEEKEEEKKLE